MKRLLSLFLVMGFLLSLLSMSAFAAPQVNFDFDLISEDKDNPRPLHFSSMFSSKGKIYLYQNGLTELDIAGKKIHKIADIEDRKDITFLYNLIPGTDAFYSLSPEENMLYSLKLKDGKLVVDESRGPIHEGQLSWEAGENAFIEEDVLYFLSSKPDPESPTGEKNAIVAYNLKTKGKKEFAEKSFQAIAPYKDGKILTYTLELDKDDRFSGKGNITIGSIDINSGAFTVLHKFAHSSIWRKITVFYHKSSDSVCYVIGSLVHRVYSEKESKVCAYVPESRGGRNIVELEDGSVAMLVDYAIDNTIFSSIALRNLDENSLPERTLKIRSFTYEEGLHDKARKAMPDVPVVLERVSWENPDGIAAGIIAAGDSFDILEIEGSYIDLSNVIAKGYAQPIESEIVKKHVDSMHSVLKESAWKDGKLYLFPKQIRVGFALYDEESFKKLGIDVPKTYADMLEAEYLFEKNDSDEKQKYQFSEFSAYGATLHGALSFYARALAAEGKELNFDTPSFRELIEKVIRNNKEIRYEEINWNDEAQVEEMFEKKTLFEWRDDSSLRDIVYATEDSFMFREAKKSLLLIKLSEEGEPFVPVHASYYLLNPRSKNLDLAIRFLENYVSSMSEKDKAPLYAGVKEALPNPNYEREKERISKYYEMLKKKYEEAEGAEKTNLENEMKLAKEGMEKNLERIKYVIPKEAMEAYHNLMSNKQLLVDFDVNFVTGSDKVLTMDLYKRFADGQISIDQLIQELNNKVKLITMEKGK